GFLPEPVGEVVQGRRGHAVVDGAHLLLAEVGQDVAAGGSAAATGPGGGRGLGDVTEGLQRVEVPADRRGGEAQLAGRLARRDRAALADRSAHPVPGAGLSGGVGHKHHVSVTYFHVSANEGPPNRI